MVLFQSADLSLVAVTDYDISLVFAVASAVASAFAMAMGVAMI